MPEQGAGLACILDVDGTLLSIAILPELAVPGPDVCELLDQLSVASEGAMALVSGRSLRELDRRFVPHRSAGASRLQALQVQLADGLQCYQKAQAQGRHPDCKAPGSG